MARSTVAIVGSHAAAARRMAVDSARRGAGRGGRRAGTDVTHPSTHPRGGSSRPVEGRARRLKNCGRRPAFSAGRFRPGVARRHDIAGPGGETTRRCAVAPWRHRRQDDRGAGPRRRSSRGAGCRTDAGTPAKTRCHFLEIANRCSRKRRGAVTRRAPRRRCPRGWPSGARRAFGQPLGIGLADDQRREHRPAAGSQDVGDHPRQLHVGLLQRPSRFPTGCRGPPDVWTGIAAACTRSGFAAPETCQLTVRFPDPLPGTPGGLAGVSAARRASTRDALSRRSAACRKARRQARRLAFTDLMETARLGTCALSDVDIDDEVITGRGSMPVSITGTALGVGPATGAGAVPARIKSCPGAEQHAVANLPRRAPEDRPRERPEPGASSRSNSR